MPHGVVIAPARSQVEPGLEVGVLAGACVQGSASLTPDRCQGEVMGHQIRGQDDTSHVWVS